MATTSRAPVQPPSNGVITAPPKSVVGGNRKKAKRRAKLAAKSTSQLSAPPSNDALPADIDYDEDPLGYAEDEDYDYSDADQHHFHDKYVPTHALSNGYSMPPPALDKKRNSRKKKKTGGLGGTHDPYDPDMLGSRLPALPDAPPPPPGHKRGPQQQNIWNTTTQQERQNIKNFWLSLSEEDRKSLLKIEKEAVLRKMKQQQKHSCSCTVCGRKRTAIEEELEVLYEGYYEELEQYAHHDHPPLPATDGILSAGIDSMLPAPLSHSHRPHPLAAPPPPAPNRRTSQVLEHLDEEEELSEEEIEYSDEEDEEEDYSDEDPEPPRGPVPDFFNFGQNLTVKDNLLTVADDLLKNDGRKFIEMMEQLAERRMQRENEAEYAATNPSHMPGYHPGDAAYGNDDSLAAGDDFDDEEASYDSQEEYEDDLEDEDEMSGLSEEQRMQEGRRMFQIFAARMFEHRVLTAYKEKVAAERQQKLLEELQDEEKLEAQREAKKKRDAEKKKDKKKQQQAAKAEEKAKKEAEKAAEEARIREAEEKKQEEQRRKKDEQRRKKEEEKRKQEEERVKKESDRLRRQQEEQQRREDAERKVRESKAAEKARKEEAKKREREEREARDKVVRERKAQEEKRELDTKSKERAKASHEPASQSQVPRITKRPSQPGMVAVPGVLSKQQTPSGLSSPHPAVATPVVPKAPTPGKPQAKQTSQYGSHASSPKQAHSQVSSGASKSSSPGNAAPVPSGSQQTFPKTSMPHKPAPGQQTTQQTHHMPANPQIPQHQMQPPPGMLSGQNHQPGGFSGVPPMGFPGYANPPGPMMPGGMRSPMPMFPHGGAAMGLQNRIPSLGGPAVNGMPGPPPGMMAIPQGRGSGFPFDAAGPSPNAPPGFGQPILPQQSSQASPIGPPLSNPLSAVDSTPRSGLPSHSRHQSASDKERFESAANQPIARPAPIQRPSSIKGQDEHADVDDLSKHLGSSALLDDSDEQPLQRRDPGRSGPLGALGGLGGPVGAFGAPGGGWNATSPFSTQGPGLGQQWGSLPPPVNTNVPGWMANNSGFATNGGFGSIGGGAGLHRPSVIHGSNRPLTIRVAVCQACRQLSGATRGEGDDYHDINMLLRQIEHNRPPLDAPPTLREVEDICETEGDAHNGGGELQVRKGGNGGVAAVRWRADAGTPDLGRGGSIGGLGEIGSPMPSKSTPAAGFGAPGMGRGLSNAGGWTGLGAGF